MKKSLIITIIALSVFSCKKSTEVLSEAKVEIAKRDSTITTPVVDTTTVKVEQPKAGQADADWRDEFMGTYEGIGYYANYQTYVLSGSFWRTVCRVELTKGGDSTGVLIKRDKITSFAPSSWSQEYFDKYMQYSARLNKNGSIAIPSQIINIQPQYPQDRGYNITGDDRRDNSRYLSYGSLRSDTLTLHLTFENVSLVDSVVLVKK